MVTQQNDSSQPSEAVPLRPSIPLIVVSILNMLIGAVAASVSLVVLELLWPHSLSYTSLLLLAWALITIIGQYLGTFHGNMQGAWFSNFGSPLCCLLLYLSVVILRFFTTDFVDQSPTEILGGRQLYLWILVGILSMTSMVLNGRWAWKLKHQAGGKVSWKPISISLREILTLCVLLGLIMIPATYRAHKNRSLYRADVAKADAPFAVPESAKAITYERDRSGLLLATYVIDETPYRQWLSRSDSEASQHAARWHELDVALDATAPSPDRLPWSLSYGNEIVNDGFRLIWQADGLSHIIIYDRDKKLAYYQQYALSE